MLPEKSISNVSTGSPEGFQVESMCLHGRRTPSRFALLGRAHLLRQERPRGRPAANLEPVRPRPPLLPEVLAEVCRELLRTLPLPILVLYVDDSADTVLVPQCPDLLHVRKRNLGAPEKHDVKVGPSILRELGGPEVGNSLPVFFPFCPFTARSNVMPLPKLPEP